MRRWKRTAACLDVRSIVLLAAGLVLGCGDGSDAPVFEPSRVEQDFVEVLPCRHSHEHELRHVRIFADEASAEIYEQCVLGGLVGQCGETVFPEGALFIKLEYEYEGCLPEDLVSYTASLRLEDGSFPSGLDWRWQRLDAAGRLVEDGSPSRCITCHVDHCSPPEGMDLRCVPD